MDFINFSSHLDRAIVTSFCLQQTEISCNVEGLICLSYSPFAACKMMSGLLYLTGVRISKIHDYMTGGQKI